MTKSKNTWNRTSWQRPVDKPTDIEMRFEDGRWIILPLSILIFINVYILIHFNLISIHLLNPFLPELTSLLIVIFGLFYCLRIWKSPPPHLARITAYTLLILFILLIITSISTFNGCSGASVTGLSCTDQTILHSRLLLSMALFGYLLKILLIVGTISLLVPGKTTDATKPSHQKVRSKK